MLCIGLKLFSVDNSDKHLPNVKSDNMLFSEPLVTSRQYIAVCATPICIFFIDIDATQIISLIHFKEINSNIIPKIIEFCQIDDYNVG